MIGPPQQKNGYRGAFGSAKGASSRRSQPVSPRKGDTGEIRVLLVEDNPGDARLVQEMLLESGIGHFGLTHVSKLGDALRCLGDGDFEAVLLDLGLPDAYGLEALSLVNEVAPEVPIVILSALEDERVAVEALQRGAQDYLVKGQGGGHLLSRSIRYAIERKQSEQYISHLAHHDALTNLPNRRLLHDRLDQALARARRNKLIVATLFIDLDHFKQINDTLGHPTGDLLLIGVAERLKGCMRESDTIARIGGDEFAMVLPEISRVEASTAFAEQVLSALKSPFVLEGNEVFVSASMGISLYPNDGEEAETLLRKADIAMYRSKQQGRDTYHFYLPAMNFKASERLELSADLRHALERQELLLHYQPLFHLDAGSIVGFEALLRWQHPRLGLVAPDRFIPLAEETGLITAIGEWVLRSACAQARKWHAWGYPSLRVYVNLSKRQLNRSSLSKTVTEVLGQTGLQPQLLELELTERGIMRNPETSIATLRELKEAGVRIAIDDFGTGYSSLSHLKNFPIDTLKIDRSFVRETASQPVNAAIVMAVITMAHGLEMEVTAEGVETAQQLAFLRQHRCDQAQGFLLGYPLPEDALPGLLREEPRVAHLR